MNSISSPDSVIFSVEEGIATITLNRPSSLNAFDLALAGDLRRLGSNVESRQDIRVLIIRGNGPAFCAGADLQMFVENLNEIASPVRAILHELGEFVSCLRRMGKIVIMSIHGSIAGGGMSLVLHGDLCIAANSTRFSPAYNRLGLSPDMGATISLPRAIGTKRCIQAFLYEDHISAQQAFEWGMVNWVVPDDQLKSETLRIAKRIAANDTLTIAETKRLINMDRGQTLESQMRDETEAIITCMRGNVFNSVIGHIARNGRIKRPTLG